MSEVRNRDLATMPFDEAIEAYSPNFEAVLPPGISVDHFRRMVISAVNTNPDLRYCDRRTFFNAALKCASDGVLPDGREAVLVPFKTKIKDKNGREHTIDAVQYMIMIAGIRKRLRNSGEVKSATAEVVYQNDRFHWQMGDEAEIKHIPAGLDEDPGDPVGAYAIILLSNGEVIREVVRKRDIDRAREMSRAKDGPAWVKWYDQMARKVALRRASKAAPSTSVLHRLEQMLDQEENGFDAAPPPPAPEDFVEPPAIVPPIDETVTPAAEPAPAAEQSADIKPQDDVRVIELVDAEGVIAIFEDPVEAYTAFCELLIDAAKISQGTLEGVWESNDLARANLAEFEPQAVNLPDNDTVAEALQRLYDSLLPSEPPEPALEEEAPPPLPPEPPATPQGQTWRDTQVPPMASAPPSQQPRRRGRPPKVRPEAQDEPPAYIVNVPDDVVVELEPLPRRAARTPEETEDDLIFARGNLSTTTYHTRLGAYIRKKRQLTGAEKWSPEKWKEFRKRNAKDLAETRQVMGNWFAPLDRLIQAGEEGR